MNEINDFISGISYISEKRKTFYLNIIEQRYTIIKNVYKKIEK